MTEIPKGRPIKKSHIIAVVLVILVALVLASFFYVFIERVDTVRPCIKTPIDIVQQNRTENSVTVLIEYAPNGAKIDGTVIAYGHNGTPERVIYAEIRDTDGSPVATYCGCDSHWSYCNSIPRTINWQKGMTLEVHVSSVHENDVLTISSTPETFGENSIMIR